MRIEIDKTAIPYHFDIDLGGQTYKMTINYNGRFDYFTIGLERDGEVLIASEKVVYGRPLFSTFEDDERMPNAVIIPMDEGGGQVDRITYDNFGETVFLMVGEIDE